MILRSFKKLISLLPLFSSTILCVLTLAWIFSSLHLPQQKAYAHAAAYSESSEIFQVSTLPAFETRTPVLQPEFEPIPTTPQTYRPGLPVLMYHYVGNYYDPSIHSYNNSLMYGLSVRVDEFEQQMNHLVQRGYQSIDFKTVREYEAQNLPLPSNTIILTFDDGYLDFYSSAFPILKKYNLKATVYVITQYVGREGYLNWDMLHELRDSGLVTIGSHTQHHYYLPSLSPRELERELVQSKVELETNLGVSVEELCYPSGGKNPSVVQAVKKAGYKSAVTTVYGRWYAGTDNLLIPRERISGSTSFEIFSTIY